jgi:hypothetical protein
MRFSKLKYLAVLVAAAASPAYAGQVTAKFTAVDYGISPINVTYTVYNTLNSPVTQTESANVGRFKWTNVSTSGTMLGQYSDPFSSFCIDLLQNISTGSTYTFNETSSLTGLPTGTSGLVHDIAMTSTAETDLKKLYDGYYDDVKTTSLSSLANYLTLGFTASGAERAAAFQLAVWEIVQDGGVSSYSLSSGRFKVNSGASANVLSIASAYLTGLSAFSGETLLGLASTVNQDQVVLVPLNAVAVPLPSAAAAALPILMLGGAVLHSKRRRYRAEQSANL